MVSMINHIADVWWNFSVSIFWQVGVLILVIACIDVCLRKHIWPQVRYALWLMVLVKLVLPPGLHSPSSVTQNVQPLAQKWAMTESVKQMPQTTSPVYRSLAQPSSVATLHLDSLSMSSQTVTPSIPLEDTEPSQPPTTPSVLALLHWHVYVMGVWITGVFTLGLWLFVRLRRLRHGLPVSQHRLPASFYNQLEHCAERVGLKKAPSIIVTQRVIVPAVMGLWRPVLLMPQGFLKQLSRKDTIHMLLHELSHIKRGDLWVHSVYMMLQILFWYNPLLWLVSRQMHHLRELCCDATVAGLLKEHTMEYRNTLLDVARRYLSRPTEPSLGLLGLFEDSNRLAVRLNWLKKDTHRFRKTRTLLIVLMVTVMLACVLPMAQAEDTPQAASQTKTETVTVMSSGDSKPATPPSEYQALIKEIEALKQKLMQTEKAAAKANPAIPSAVSIAASVPTSGSSVAPVPSQAPASVSVVTQVPASSGVTQVPVSSSSNVQTDPEKEALRQKVQELDQVQQLLKQELMAVVEQLEKSKRDEQGLKDKLKHLDSAKDKMKDMAQDLAAKEKRLAIETRLQHLTDQLGKAVDVNDVQVFVKSFPDKIPHEILPQIQQWQESGEFKQWQKDMKAWEKDMEGWSKQWSKGVEQKAKNFKPGADMKFDIKMPNMPPMPEMPKMPHMPFHQEHRVDIVVPSPAPVPTPNPFTKIEVTPQVDPFSAPEPPVQEQIHVETHVVKVNPDQEINAVRQFSLSFPGDNYEGLTLGNQVGDIKVVGSDKEECTAKVTIKGKGEDNDLLQTMMDQVNITSSQEKNILVLKPTVPKNTDDAQVSVDFILIVPKAWTLTLRTEVGNFKIDHMLGKINCQNNVGDITVTVRTEPEVVKAQTNVGNIFLNIKPDADVKIAAITGVGNILSDQTFKTTPTNMTGAKGVLTLGSGKTPVNLKVNVGSIHIKTPSDLDKAPAPESSINSNTNTEMHIIKTF